MNTAKKIYRSDEQGLVHLDVPVGNPGQQVEVLVVWEAVEEEEGAQPEEERAAMAACVGLLEPDDLERPSQGKVEVRRSFE